MTSPVAFDDFARLVQRPSHVDVRGPGAAGRRPRSSSELCGLVTWAPNHKKTWPWRFALFTGDGRARLGDDDGRRHDRRRLRRRGQAAKTRDEVPAHARRARRRRHRRTTTTMLDAENRDAVAAGDPEPAARGDHARARQLLVDARARRSRPRVLELCGFDADRPHRRDDLPRLGERTDAGAGTAAGRDQPHRRLNDAPDAFRSARISVRAGPFGETEAVSDTRPTMITLDLEGVLVPEIWIAVAERTGHRRTAPHHPRRAGLRRPDEVPARPARRARPDDVADRGRDRRARRRWTGAEDFLDDLRSPHPGDHPVGHVRTVRPAADAPARLADDPVPPPRRRERPHRRLPPPPGRPEAPLGRGVPLARLPRHRRRRQLQRHLDAASRPTPASCSTRRPT